MKNAHSLPATEHKEFFLAFNARVVPLAVLLAVLWAGVGWFTPPIIVESGVKVPRSYSDYLSSLAIVAGFFYFCFLLAWVIERIIQAKGGQPKTLCDLSFREANVRTVGWVILGALLPGGLITFNLVNLSFGLQREWIWPVWAPVIVIGALFYSIVVLDWLSHRVYRAAARKLLPAH